MDTIKIIKIGVAIVSLALGLWVSSCSSPVKDSFDKVMSVRCALSDEQILGKRKELCLAVEGGLTSIGKYICSMSEEQVLSQHHISCEAYNLGKL